MLCSVRSRRWRVGNQPSNPQDKAHFPTPEEIVVEISRLRSLTRSGRILTERYGLVTSVISASCRRSLIIGAMPAIIQDQGTVKKAKYARFLWPIFRGIVVLVAAWGFIAFLSVDLYGGELGFTAFVVFAIAMLALRVMPFEPVTPLHAIEGDWCGLQLGMRVSLVLSTIRPVVCSSCWCNGFDYGLVRCHRNCRSLPDYEELADSRGGLRICAGRFGWCCLEVASPSVSGSLAKHRHYTN